jgi:formylglycine-generating enzyme required for sulfatase activity
MVVIQAGSFEMGTPAGAYEVDEASGEGPPIPIDLRRSFALGRTEVTRAQFADFTAATGHELTSDCQPTEATSPDHPMSCVKFEDAAAYIQWLATETKQPYRLPSESEWEYAARAGTTWPRPWGANNSFEGVSISLSCDHANVYDTSAQAQHSLPWPYARCNDQFPEVAPVGSFPANAYRLHDMIGNLREWTADCFTASYWGRPADERPWTWSGGCEQRVVRGGGWRSRPTDARPARRQGENVTTAANDLGFRVARDLSDEETPPPPSSLGRIVLFTEDVEQAKRFWTERFGYELAFEDTEFVDQDIGHGSGIPNGTTVHFVILRPADPDEPLIGLIGTPEGTRVVIQPD